MRFGVRLATDVLAEGLTVARLARLIEAEDSAAQPGLALALQPLGDGAPFYCLPGIGGDPTQLARWRAGWAPGGRSWRCAAACRRSPTGRTGSRTSPPATSRRCWRGIRAARSCSAAIRWARASPTRWRSSLAAAASASRCWRLIDARRPDWRLTAGNAPATLWQSLRNLPHFVRDDLLPGGFERRGALPAPPPARAARASCEARSDTGHHPLHRRALRRHGALSRRAGRLPAEAVAGPAGGAARARAAAAVAVRRPDARLAAAGAGRRRAASAARQSRHDDGRAARAGPRGTAARLHRPRRSLRGVAARRQERRPPPGRGAQNQGRPAASSRRRRRCRSPGISVAIPFADLGGEADQSRGVGHPGAAVRRTPHPGPLPQGERGRKAYPLRTTGVTWVPPWASGARCHFVPPI